MYENNLHWWTLPAVVVTAAATQPAYAVQYLTLAQAQRVLFPDADRFISRPVQFSSARKREIERYAGVRLLADRQPVWRVQQDGRDAGWFVEDEVYGKHEFITYAVGLDSSGGVIGVEILDYRETHGGEVRDKAWRAQFTGKHYGEALRLGDGIENISGATLSCKHLTEGVRRVLAVFQAALK